MNYTPFTNIRTSDYTLSDQSNALVTTSRKSLVVVDQLAPFGLAGGFFRVEYLYSGFTNYLSLFYADATRITRDIRVVDAGTTINVAGNNYAATIRISLFEMD